MCIRDRYASNPDIDASRSKYNFHIVKRSGRYYHFIQNRIEQAGCRTRRDSTRFVDTLVTASPESVSYTHLDVYKRQGLVLNELKMKHLIGANGELNPKYPGGIIAQRCV